MVARKARAPQALPGRAGRVGVDDAVRGWLRLARCPRLRTREAIALGRRIGPEAFADPAPGTLAERGVPRDLADRLCGRSLTRRIEHELRTCRRRGWHLLGLDGPLYPPQVAQLAVPPPVLSVAGDPAVLSEPAVAIVGSRRPTTYGLTMAETLAGGLAARGLLVVSGLALGIDGRSHRSALEAGGRTAAVLGTGLDVVYPREHARLAAHIAERGALVTEFPPGTRPKPGHFPRRNRIIVGLADAVVVVEAAIPSGTLVTARWATEENRTVLAVPGRVGDELSAGCLELLRDGASPALGVDDVLAELRPERIPQPVTERAARHGTRPAPAPVGPFCAEVLAAIPERDDCSVEELLERVDGPTDRVLSALFELELAGLVAPLAGGRYRRTAAG
ncbi:MAG: DNA-protecting protein DprA [Acidobacteria bacterium]|nr:MAG: DNA-protecting protein DprA [Acidobacteriota bacterium]